MTSSTNWGGQVVDNIDTRRLADYKEIVSALFPTLPRDLVDAWSIKDVDALVLALFVRCYPHKMAALEVGTFVGVSTFHLASQPKITRVLSVDINPLITDEASAASEVLDVSFDRKVLPEVRVQEVARAALAEFADESAKVQLLTGSASSAWKGGHQGDAFDNSGKTEMLALEPGDSEPLLAYLDGARTREAVDADLKAIFESTQRAVAVLDGCRGAWSPFVQAGVASFLESTQGTYHFQLLGNLSSGLATSNLGVVYPEADSVEVQRSLAELSHLFSERLDPLWLAGREQELISVVNAYKDQAKGLRMEHEAFVAKHEAFVAKYESLADRETALQRRISQLQYRESQLEKRNSQLEERKSQLAERKSQLEKRNSQLEERKSQLEKDKAQLEKRRSQLEKEKSLRNSQMSVFRASRRYRAADAVAESVLRIPGARALARRHRQSE
jgi:hypothetical protein